LPLPQVWDAVSGGPPADVRKFRDELLWQEYARHLYARLGSRSQSPLRFRPVGGSPPDTDPWQTEMACVGHAVDELSRTGWVVNQARMWLASHWAVRHHADWRAGENRFFTQLLDGSRAANRLGWQWTAGLLTGRSYGFSRSQVERRAPGMCEDCPLEQQCPIEDWPADIQREAVTTDPRLRHDPDVARTAGSDTVVRRREPQAVWLTAESLGDDDPALRARPELPVVFVFDAPLLRTLGLSGQRLVFLAETLGDLADRREVKVYCGRPADILADLKLAATFAPVPGWRRLSQLLDIAEMHPWLWLRRPHDGPIGSFSAWRRSLADRLS
jgi:deoxyribodipyrimidine photo-lyase